MLLQFTAVTANVAHKVQAPIFCIFLVVLGIYGFAVIIFLNFSPWQTWYHVGGPRIKTT